MIEAVLVEGFRGLRRLKVEGLGRVNLIIGKNDSGKTALMEAVMVVYNLDAPGGSLAFSQELRHPSLPVQDFDRFWLPLFWNQNAVQGMTMDARFSEGDMARMTIRRAESHSDVIMKSNTRATLQSGAWALDVHVQAGAHQRNERIEATPEGVKFPVTSEAETRGGGWWIKPNKTIQLDEIRYFSKLKQDGRDVQLIEILKQVDARVSGLELLAPTGTEAELFVRLEPGTPLVNLMMMGDGFQRCFELGVAAMATHEPILFVDEFENGLHHSALEPVWSWLAALSMTRSLQIFATTHSEECVQAACRAFTAGGDEGLRVIRLDRRQDETVATVYDRSLVEAATEMGVEIRG